MSQLTQITFNTVSGGQVTLSLQDYDTGKELDYWQGNEKALSGKLRHNLRGSRGVYRIQYEKCIEPTKYRNLYNDIVSDLQTGDSITISEGSDLSNARVVVPTETFNQNIEYKNQLGNFVPDMEFRDIGLNRLDTRYVEVGYVNEGYVE